jgi:hypothetical protein
MRKYHLFAGTAAIILCMACQSGPSVHDKSVSVEKSSTLYIHGALKVKSFDGKQVSWGKRGVIIPAGSHEFTVDYYNEFPQGEARGAIHTAKGIIVQYSFEEGRFYSMNFQEEKAEFFNEKLVRIVFKDETEYITKREAQKKEKERREAGKDPVPQPSSDPTVLEGVWRIDQYSPSYTFSGNSWRKGYYKGVFIIDGTILKLYTLYEDYKGNDNWKKHERYQELLFTLKDDGTLELNDTLNEKTEAYYKQ